MNYPSISEYIESIRSAEDNFESLSALHFVPDDSGNPVMSSGNFAVVFKMTDGNKYYAVKCFTREQEGRAEAYRQICEELKYVSSTFLSKIRYYDKELFVDTNATTETEFPVLLMDWVDGVPLDRFVSDHLNDHYTIGLLCYQFCRMAQWLMTQPFAHGDLKPDNILVQSDGSIVLVDYDGMYVPAMKGQKSREMGSPNYRHPLRSEDQFDEHIDDFALCVIALSLKALSLQPSLFHDFGSSDRLLFSDADYRDLSSSRLVASLQSLMGDGEFNRLYALFLLGHSHQALTDVSFRLFGVTKPEKPALVEVLSTKATDEDLANAWEDEYGVKYSRDGKKLLKAPNGIENYTIRQGTEMVCDDAFSNCCNLQSITIPDSVTSIGNYAFFDCYSLESITIPDSVTSIGDSAFCDCSHLQSITIPDSVTSIGCGAFSGCDLDIILESTRYSTDGVCLFDSKRTEIISCFKSSIEEYAILGSVTSIGDWSFGGCKSLKNITIPDSVTSIGYRAFGGCKSLKNITIPDSVTSIGEGAFSHCCNLQSITIPDSVTRIGDWAFDICKSLNNITIPDSVTSIGDGAFYGCESLKSITIPDSVTSIGNYAFLGCESLKNITIPDSVTSIGDSAFCDCSHLQSITIPDSVTSIGDGVFEDCESLQSIYIPRNTRSKFAQLLPDYIDKLTELSE